MDNKINIVLFSGGRGASAIVQTFIKSPQISLTCLVNAYDDGLSTGKLRRFIPGMLGPSDIRKNIINLMPSHDCCQKYLKFLLEYRFPREITTEEAIDCLDSLRSFQRSFSLPGLAEAHSNLSLKQVIKLQKYGDFFFNYAVQQKKEGNFFDFQAASLGNILFSGCYLSCNRDFNKTTGEFKQFCEIMGNILNITDGRNYVLTAYKEDGTLLRSEAEIVAPQNSSLILDIFLLEEYLDSSQAAEIESSSRENALQKLSALAHTPQINPEAFDSLKEADVIIYCPGTQHSSLYPSYLTGQAAEAIIANRKAEKVYISNILEDCDIQGENANSLTDKFKYYMSRKKQIPLDWDKLVTHFFFQEEKQSDPVTASLDKYVVFNREDFNLSMDNVKYFNWEAQTGMHSGGLILDELVGIIQSKIQLKISTFHHTVSIIVPALNEERTVKQVLHQLTLLDFGKYGLYKEIIFVDGNSVDKTLELAKSEKGVQVYRLAEEFGRGAALRYGIEKARGNIIIFYPSDNEYEPNDLYSVIESLLSKEYKVVFGSRTVKFMNFRQKVLEIYNGNHVAYFISKYGGFLLSTFSFIFYNKFISDTLTGIKGFDAKLLKDLNLTSYGVDLDMEIIAKVSKKEEFILEIPVEYFPRTKKEGKKTTVWDGLKALFALIKYSFYHFPRTIHKLD